MPTVTSCAYWSCLSVLAHARWRCWILFVPWQSASHGVWLWIWCTAQAWEIPIPPPSKKFHRHQVGNRATLCSSCAVRSSSVFFWLKYFSGLLRDSAAVLCKRALKSNLFLSLKLPPSPCTQVLILWPWWSPFRKGYWVIQLKCRQWILKHSCIVPSLCQSHFILSYVFISICPA